jgi:hypothetical protein
MKFGSGIALALGLALLSCRARERMDKPSVNQTTIDIVPRRSIGKIVLGAKTEELPKGAVISGVAGELEGVHFLLADGRVDDVWIDDLRTLPGVVRHDGRPIAKDASLADVKALFGPCMEVKVKGGAFYNCATGVTIGTDFAQEGQFIQLRLKPR